MENIVIRKSVTPKLAANLGNILRDGINWMRNKYPDVNFDNVNFIFSQSFRRSRYFRNTNNVKYPKPTVCIATTATLYLYDKRSLGIKTKSIYVGSTVQIMCAIIHELTHHVQYETKIRMGNELDTTRNEMEFLCERHLKLYNKITTTK